MYIFEVWEWGGGTYINEVWEWGEHAVVDPGIS